MWVLADRRAGNQLGKFEFMLLIRMLVRGSVFLSLRKTIGLNGSWLHETIHEREIDRVVDAIGVDCIDKAQIPLAVLIFVDFISCHVFLLP